MVLSRGQGEGEEHRGLRRLLEGRRGPTVTAADRAYLARAAELAARAIPDAAPNPPVGCVLVRDSVTLGEGWHHRRGEPHAEAEALRDARARGADPAGATAYVTLEPCDHHGRTPPCSAALIDARVARVVAGASDPDPRTQGGGLRRLRAAGIAVERADDARSRALIERFAHWATRATPFLTLKMASSLDGALAPQGGEPYWLTGPAARERVRELRWEHDAVLVGAGTVRVDDPQLTLRPHRTRRKPYVRVVVCESDTIPAASRILAPPPEAADAYARTIVLAPGAIADRFAPLRAQADVVAVGDGATLDLDAALRALREREIVSVLCEGGPTLAGRLLERALVQRVVWFVAPRLIRTPDAVAPLAGADVTRYASGWTFDRVERVGDDVLLSARLPDEADCAAPANR